MSKTFKVFTLTLSKRVLTFELMRDDRYRGTSLPKAVRKLCRMAEREADHARPDRLGEQAVAALISVADQEISPEFRRQLRQHDTAPKLFGANDIVAGAGTRLEVEIAQNINAGLGVEAAVTEAFRRRGEGYAHEQHCQLVADHHHYATTATQSVKTAFEHSAPIAATVVLGGQSPPKANTRVQLTENLLVQPTTGAGQ